MNNKRLRCGLVCLSLLSVASSAAAADGDSATAAELYGRGVHAYFGGRMADAEALLSRARALDGNDPRFLYFRALSLLRMGRVDEARADMQDGAALEARQLNRHAVGVALQRVQGGDRLMLECYRRQARSRARAGGGLEGPPFADRPFAPPAIDDANVLRNRVVIPLDELLRPEGPQPLTPEEIRRRAALFEASRAAAAAAPPAEPAAPAVGPFDAEPAAEAPPAPVLEAPVDIEPPTAEEPPPAEEPFDADDPFSDFN